MEALCYSRYSHPRVHFIHPPVLCAQTDFPQGLTRAHTKMHKRKRVVQFVVSAIVLEWLDCGERWSCCSLCSPCQLSQEQEGVSYELHDCIRILLYTAIPLSSYHVQIFLGRWSELLSFVLQRLFSCYLQSILVAWVCRHWLNPFYGWQSAWGAGIFSSMLCGWKLEIVVVGQVNS